MILRRMLFWLAAVLGCIISWGAECQTRAEAPEEYRDALNTSKRFWKGAKQNSVVVNWNPKAPGLAALKMNVDIDVHDDQLRVYSAEQASDQRFAALFSDSGVVIADGQLRTVSLVTPFDPHDGGATTGLPAELLAMRLLVLASAMPVLTQFAETPRKLTDAEEQRLAKSLFPDSPSFLQGMRRPRTVFRITEMDAATKYEWLDDHGKIFELEACVRNSEELKRHRSDYEWTTLPRRKLTMPRVRQLAARLIDAEALDGIEGQAIAMGKNGARFSEPLEKLADESAEMIRVRLHDKIGTITVSRASPIGVKDVGFMKHTNDQAIGRVATVVDVPDTRAFCLDGQDWLVTVTLPELNSGSDAAGKLVLELEKWLQALNAQR